MSLIQEALEKANKARTASETFFEVPKRVTDAEPVQVQRPAQLPVQTIRIPQVHEAPVFKPKTSVPAPIQISPEFLIRVSVMAAILLCFGALALCLSRAGGSPSAIAISNPPVVVKSSVVPVAASNGVKFTLTGITDSTDGRLALINNQVVSVGDSLQEKALVKEIQPRSVTLELNRKEVKLFL